MKLHNYFSFVVYLNKFEICVCAPDHDCVCVCVRWLRMTYTAKHDRAPWHTTPPPPGSIHHTNPPLNSLQCPPHFTRRAPLYGIILPAFYHQLIN